MDRIGARIHCYQPPRAPPRRVQLPCQPLPHNSQTWPAATVTIASYAYLSVPARKARSPLAPTTRPHGRQPVPPMPTCSASACP